MSLPNNLDGAISCCEGIYFSDYVMPMEDTEDCLDRCRSILGFDPTSVSANPFQPLSAVAAADHASPVTYLEGKAPIGSGMPKLASATAPAPPVPLTAEKKAATSESLTDASKDSSKGQAVQTSSNSSTGPETGSSDQTNKAKDKSTATAAVSSSDNNNCAAYFLVAGSVAVAVVGFLMR